MKKICFIAQFPPPVHGLSKAVETLYDSDLQLDFDFEKVDLTDNKRFLSNLAAIRKSKADLFYFTISQTTGGNLRDLIILKTLRKQHKPCLVHLHGGYYRKLVDHDLSEKQRRANYNAVADLAGAIVLSDSLKPIFQGMLPDERIHVVENCVDNAVLLNDEQIALKMSRFRSEPVLHILWLSNFIATKGYRDVLALADLEHRRRAAGGAPRFHFDFAGKFFDSDEENYFNTFVADHGLSDCITYHGVVSGEKKVALLEQGALFILPTRYPNEGQPISILEAMGNGMFIITTDHAGIPDIVTAGTNGILMTVDRKPADLYDELMTLTNATICNIGTHNRNYCLENFSEQAYLNKMKKIFQEI